MKIIKRGKYADKVYKCENCGCEFEINYLDINIERFDMVGGYYNIVGDIMPLFISLYINIMILIIIISLLIGYFIGMISCLLQVIRMENRENKKIKEILDND